MINKIKDIIYSVFFRENVVISENNTLENSVIIVTGAGRGIGKSTAEVLSKMGAKLTLVSRDVDKLKKIFKGENYLIISATVTDKNMCNKIANATVKKLGRIDGLFNNAGVFLQKDTDKISDQEFNQIVDTNIKGLWNMTSAVIPFMKKAKNGIIIQMGSKISHNSNIESGRALYALTKYAVEGFSVGLRNELEPFGIRVTCLMPSTVKTFRSALAYELISPYTIAELISLLIKNKSISYESILLKNIKQTI